jgi:Tol biopolymer transport system component
VVAALTPPAGVALVNAIRGDDPRTNQRIVDDARIVEQDDDRGPPRERSADEGSALDSGPQRRGAPTTDAEPRGAASGVDKGGATSRTVASLGLTGRLAFTAMDKPVGHWVNECFDGPCFYYNPSDIQTMDLRTGKVAPVASSPLFEQGSRWSPDGSRLAYSVARGDTTAALHTISADGTDDRQIVSIEGRLAFKPTWSPDGRRIAFLLRERSSPFGMTGCCAEIWMVDADGTDLHRVDEITETEGRPTSPAWSPDGRYLAFARADYYGTSFQTWILDLVTRRIEYFASGDDPVWSPDGKRLAVANGESVEVLSVRLRGVLSRIEAPGRLSELAWSPDGDWIAFAASKSNTPEGAYAERSIWVARPNGKDMTVVVRGEKDYWAPTWAR